MLPTKERRDRVTFWLAKAKTRYPSVKIACIMVLSNHMHIVLRDDASNLSAFMRDFLGHSAKSINRLDKVRGAFFDRRYTAIPIVDLGAATRRIIYALLNPVEAGLVRRHQDWKGLWGWFGGAVTEEEVTYFHEGRYEKARREAEKTGAYVPRSDFEETIRLIFDAFDGLDAEEIRAAVLEKEAELAKKHARVLGMERVLQQSPFDHPKLSKRSKMPLCLYTKKAAKEAFAAMWYDFVAVFRAASHAFRSGDLTAKFPMFSFRPSVACL